MEELDHLTCSRPRDNSRHLQVLYRDYGNKLDAAADEADVLATLGNDLKELSDLVDDE